MPTAYIALGSNLGDRAETLSSATDRLDRLGRVTAHSSLYETEPVGYRDQPAFLNAVVALETHLEPLPLLRGLLAMLVLGDSIVAGEELSLPHPALAQRRFVLAPLVEIAPGLRHPQSNQTMAELLALLPDEGENRIAAVRKLSESS